MRIGLYTAKIYTDNVDAQDIPECSFPIRDNQSLNKIMKKWEKHHEKCTGCLECSSSLTVKDVDYDKSVLIVKVDKPIKTDQLQELHSLILEQKNSGVVILPPELSAFWVPKDIEVQLENGDNLQL